MHQAPRENIEEGRIPLFLTNNSYFENSLRYIKEIGEWLRRNIIFFLNRIFRGVSSILKQIERKRKKMKKITFRELLNLIYEGKQPKRIVHYNTVYKFENNTYLEESEKEGKSYLTDVIRNYTEGYLAKYREFSYEETILDEKEKEYLSNIIKPFKKYVCCIKKIEEWKQEYICIFYVDYLERKKVKESHKAIILPPFKKGTMYRGMELYKEYTVEDLGL